MALSLESRQALIDALRRYAKAGISPLEAFEAIADDGGGLRGPARRAGQAIEAGATLTEALDACGAGLGEMERAVFEAGEASGRLEAACAYVSGWLAAQISTRRQIFRRSLYPLFLLHAAAFVGPLPSLVLGGAGLQAYLLAVVGVLVAVYLAAFVAVVLFQLLWALGERVTLVDVLWRAIPVVGRIWRDGALGRFCGAMNAQIRAGIPPTEALPRAAAAARIAGVRQATRQAVSAIVAGHSMTDGLRQASAGLPKPLLRALETGETTGQLDEEFERWSLLFQENEAAAWEAIGDWTPKLIYLAIAIVVGWQIIRAAQGLTQQYQQMLDAI